MTKADLISMVADNTSLKKKNADIIVNAVFDTIINALVNGEKISIVGFGVFEIHNRKEKKVINPKTKKIMIVPASKAPVFKAGKTLKKIVNKN